MKLKLFTALTCLYISAAHAATFNFEVDAVSTCEVTAEPTICEPVTEYRVYDVTGDNMLFVGGDEATTFTRNYPAESNVEICFVATAFNGLESMPTDEVCLTPTVARPLAPGYFDVTFN